MCGISGIIKKNSSDIKSLENEVRIMNLSLKHRGPDNSGIWIDNTNGIALGHQRLSILDLSAAGNQPMQSHDSSIVISFNGEIYNHLEIRKKLENYPHKDFKWKSNTDTETLLRAFDVWGISETLQICSGMFALAIWDKKKKF